MNDTTKPGKDENAFAESFHRKFILEAPLTAGELMAAAMDDLDGPEGERIRQHLDHSAESRALVEQMKSRFARFAEEGLLGDSPAPAIRWKNTPKVVAGAVESMMTQLSSTCDKFQRELTGFVAWMGGGGGIQSAAAGTRGMQAPVPSAPGATGATASAADDPDTLEAMVRTIHRSVTRPDPRPVELECPGAMLQLFPIRDHDSFRWILRARPAAGAEFAPFELKLLSGIDVVRKISATNLPGSAHAAILLTEEFLEDWVSLETDGVEVDFEMSPGGPDEAS